jgi:hypothetical protein
MKVNLSDEQREALESSLDQPLPIRDEQSHRVYYLLNEEAFLHLQSLNEAHDQRCHERLRQLIDEGIQTPGVPANEAFARLRTWAEDLSRTSP